MSAHATGTGANRTQRIVWAALATTLAGVVAIGVWRLVSGGAPAADLPVYGTVPAFSLVERDGRTVTADDLRGRVWVANFIFTRCTGMCPGLSARMAALLRRQAKRPLTAVSFTVDPTRDDPATLQRYAERLGAEPARWLFLTGQRDAVERLVRDGFRLSIAELPPDAPGRDVEPITHSDRFALVDGELRIRGYYHGTDDESIAALEHDLARLIRPAT